MKKIIELIAILIVKLPYIGKDEDAELHAQRIYDLYDCFYCLTEDDLDSLENDLRHDYLIYGNGVCVGISPAGNTYTSEDTWWWYLDCETHTNRAISVRTGEILDEDDMSVYDGDDVIPYFEIRMVHDEYGYDAEVSVYDDPYRPWMCETLNSITAYGRRKNEVIADILHQIDEEFSGRYHYHVKIKKDNYDVKINERY